jgi:hypothetical protein
MVEFMLVILFPLWGWLAIKVIEQSAKIVALEQRMMSQENTCSERLQWMRDLESTMKQVAEDTLVIRTKLGETPHAD